MAKGVIRRVKADHRQNMVKQFARTKTQFQKLAETEADTIQKDFEAVVADWQPENQPRFVREVTVQKEQIGILVRPDKRQRAGQIFTYVDKGTEPHEIKPKPSNKSGRLAFQLHTQAITRPVGQHGLRPQGPLGSWVRPQKVNHPGSKARQFSETIHKKSPRRFRKNSENLFRQMARRISKGK
ncbi:hypothetical protein ACFLYO_09730 [Chloroflexota bacterium]